MSVAESEPETDATNVRWSVFSLAFAISALLYLHRYVFAFIKPTLANEWKLTNTQLGQLDWRSPSVTRAFSFRWGSRRMSGASIWC